MNGDPFEHFIISIIISHQMKIVIRQKNKGTKGNIVFLTVNEHGKYCHLKLTTFRISCESDKQGLLMW